MDVIFSTLGWWARTNPIFLIEKKLYPHYNAYKSQKEVCMFEFNYTLDSSLELAGSRMLKKYTIILHIVFALIISFKYFFNFFKTKDYFQLLMAFLSIIIFYALMFIISMIKKLMPKVNSKFLDQKVNIIFSDENINVKTKKQGSFETSQTYEWNMIWKFTQDKSYYVLYLSRLKSYIIPKGSCTSANEEEFASFVENKLKEVQKCQ